MFSNSADKIVLRYVGAVAKSDFTYNGDVVRALPLRVSPDLFRGYTCPPGCGGCCFKFSLVYLPEETWPYDDLEPFTIEINGKAVQLFHDRQAENTSQRCRHLQRDDGRCGIHGRHPFSCDFELIRVTEGADRRQMTTRLFGRGWSFPRVDGQRGALCEIVPESAETRADVLRKLHRLDQWCRHLGVDTHLDTIIDWGQKKVDRPLILRPKRRGILDVIGTE